MQLRIHTENGKVAWVGVCVAGAAAPNDTVLSVTKPHLWDGKRGIFTKLDEGQTIQIWDGKPHPAIQNLNCLPFIEFGEYPSLGVCAICCDQHIQLRVVMLPAKALTTAWHNALYRLLVALTTAWHDALYRLLAALTTA